MGVSIGGGDMGGASANADVVSIKVGGGMRAQLLAEEAFGIRFPPRSE